MQTIPRTLALAAFVLTGPISSLYAQSFFTTPAATYLEPNWRGDSGTEFSHWDILYSPYGDPSIAGDGINYPDMEAPNGIGQLASEAGFTAPGNSSPTDPYAFWHAANPTLRQTGTPSAFIIGPGAAGNVYSFAAATQYEVADSTPFTLGSVVLQWQTDGQLMDNTTLKLVANGNEYLPTNFITEYKTSGSAMGGLQNRTAAQWDLTGLGITSYTITFSAEGSSNSFQEALVDTTPTYVEAVPSARTWIANTGTWSNSANWNPGSLPATGGNLNITSGSSITVDGGTRTVGELKLSAPGAFTIGAGGGTLKLNTGITATPASPTVYNIDAPVTLGAYNLTFLNANTDLSFNAPIGGSVGFYFYGAGTMRLKANNNFAGPVTLDGGTLEISGTNTYTGGTTVFGGSLILKADALAGSGALGTAVSNVTVGSGGTFGLPEAALIASGPRTIARNIALSAGSDPKKLGGVDTGTGALFSGNVILNSTATNVRFHAENAEDIVTFSGGVSGGGTSGTITKTGLGRVVYSGAAKTYANITNVASGTLEIAAGSTFSGNGTFDVSSGATLLVHGTLNGTGSVTSTGGTIGGNGTINRGLLLDAGDTLAPGASVGTFNTVGQIWAAGGRFRLELADANSMAGTGWDLANLSGSLNVLAGAGEFTLALSTLGTGGLMEDFDPSQNYSWRFATASGGIVDFSPADFTIDASGFLNPRAGGTFNVSQAGNDLLLNFVAVPEPSSAALLGAAGLLLGRRRRAAR